MNTELSDHIEALLFYKGEPVSVRDLSRMAGVGEVETREALAVLKERLTGGIRLVLDSDRALLATAPEYTASIESLIKEEFSKDLGKAGSETLAIVLYMGPITRARIDHIRGVNSTFVLRHLSVRGLVEKIQNPDDSRSMLYRPTLELLAHLGVGAVADLPEYEAIRNELAGFERRGEGDDAEALKSTQEEEDDPSFGGEDFDDTDDLFYEEEHA